MQSNDDLWKGILEDLFDDFLRFMHPNADEIFDFGRGIQFPDKELEQLFPPGEDEFSVKYATEFPGARLEYHYNVYKISEQSEEELLHFCNSCPHSVFVIETEAVG
ncbi:MAG: hypothetical protein LBR52_05800 [Prevotellaceae bacterium]|jgi:hypothetical protein|nr:hypothetical protein [Prevotellaceae bacterium]